MTDWETIVRTHGPMAFDTAWRLLGNVSDAEDAVQDAFLDAFRWHARQTVGNWGGVIRQFTTRRSIDRLRLRPSLQPLDYEPITSADRPETAAIERELANQLRQAIAELPDREAEVFSLRYFGEMTNTEIGDVLGITTAAVAVALYKARAKLKERLEVATPRRRRSVP